MCASVNHAPDVYLFIRLNSFIRAVSRSALQGIKSRASLETEEEEGLMGDAEEGAMVGGRKHKGEV